MEHNDDISRAVQAAEAERDKLVETLRSYDALVQRIKKLESFISMGKGLLGLDADVVPAGGFTLSATGTTSSTSTTTASSTASTTTSIKPIEKPLAEGIVEILRLTGKAMSLSDLEDAFRARNWKLSPQNGREVLRSTVNKKKEFFVKKHIGNMALYELKDDTQPLLTDS